MVKLSKETITNLEVIKDKNVSTEVKAYIVLELLHNKEITLKKTKELFTEIGVFSDHWMAIDAKAVESFVEKYK